MYVLLNFNKQSHQKTAGCWKYHFKRYVSMSILIILLLLCIKPTHAMNNARIQFKGNELFNKETYLAILNLNRHLRVNWRTAVYVRRKMLRFLRRAGYILARVKVLIQQGKLIVVLDEGRLEKVLFIGFNSFTAIRLKMALNMPYKIFNRPYLKRQLDILCRRFGWKNLYYKIVRLNQKNHTGLQLEGLGRFQGTPIISQRALFELHIWRKKVDWRTGLAFNINYNHNEGLGVWLKNRDRNLFFKKDRWWINSKLGGTIRYNLDDNSTYPNLTRAFLEMGWMMPPLNGSHIRPILWLRNNLRSQQRKNKGIELYYTEILEGALNLGYDFSQGLLVSFGGGIQDKLLFGVKHSSAVTNGITPRPWRTRPFLTMHLKWDFNPLKTRKDHVNFLEITARRFWVEGGLQFNEVRLTYRSLISFGWHDLIITGKGVWLWGYVAFDEQESVGGTYLRGIFNDSFYTDRVIQLSLDFRYSLIRDILKFSIFHDLVYYHNIDLDGYDNPVCFANAFGFGFNMLILDQFQFDILFSYGFNSNKDFDNGISFKLSKVF